MRKLYSLALGLLIFAAADAPAKGDELVKELIGALKDPDKDVRTFAAAALTRLDGAVPALIEAVRGKDNALRAESARIIGMLGVMGRRHPEAIPALVEALKAEDKDVRQWSAYALSHVVLQAEDAPKRVADQHMDLIAALMEALKDPEEKVRIYAHAALVGLGRDAVPALVEALKGDDNALRVKAAHILAQMGTMGRRHPAAIPALTAALKDKDADVRKAAAYALSQIVESSDR